MERVLNFAAGPSQLPEEVLLQAQKDLFSYPGAGTSVMEMSHRSAEFQDIIDRANATLRRIMNIPENYEVLFLTGGATTQFSMVPMNLTKQGETTAYAVTGNFAGKALDEAARWGNAVAIASSKDQKFTYIPKLDASMIPEGAKYLHITGNNTIFGTAYKEAPKVGSIDIVADWSSAILGQKINVADYALIYAGAQKNIGPAGLTVVIIRKDLLDREVDKVVPIMLRYKTHADKGSMYNTPPCWNIYMSGLVFEWVEKQGGVEEMERRNLEKSSLLYDFIDNSKLYTSTVAKEDRSIMNIPFTLPTEELTKQFIKEAKEAGIVNIKGHKLVGGCRASIYNGMPLEGVKKLVEFMKGFENVQH